MSSNNQPVGVPFQNPTDYTGPKMDLVPIRRFQRRPLVSDKKYRIGQTALLGKNPTTGREGELWYLARFDERANAIWVLLGTGVAMDEINSITTDDGAPPVIPDISGNINLFGGRGINVNGNGPGNTIFVAFDGDVIAEQYNANTGSATPSGGMLNILGTGGITTSGTGNTITIMGAGGSGGFTWNIVGGTTQLLALGNGYFGANAGTINYTLPTTANIGDSFAISSLIGTWTLNLNTGQNIRMGNITTTPTTGTLSSTDIGDTIWIVCSVTNTSFQVINSMGNITWT